VRSAEIRAVGELAGAAAAGTGTLVRDVHAAIARRAFAAAGTGAIPARALHDGISATVYGSVRVALGVLPRGAGAVLARADGAALTESPRASLALAALNGAIGDALERDRSALALSMTLRHRGVEVDPDAPTVDATARVAVFVHGLGETDAAWRLRANRDNPWYGERLRRDLGYTPLAVRYNTGRSISDNGRDLARLLERLFAGWTVPVTEIVLVGHSMGGLVARSACHHGGEWTDLLRYVVCLGSPHRGAPLAKGAHLLGWALQHAPETRPFARIVDGRSQGIKDLRHGVNVPLLPNARLYFVAATLSGRRGDPLGDLLVRYPSASGAGSDGRHLGGLTHFHLLNDPAVYEQLRDWLA
jgi:pimeloyl-ACP methyl ester carboxylesterase